MMTIETSKTVGQFLKNNLIKTANLMGGEFFCNPNWFDVLSNIMKGLSSHARIVSNSDWAASKETTQKVIEFGKTFNVYFALSVDKWHTNKYVEKAQQILDDNNIECQLGNHEEDEENSFNSSIVPIGKSLFSYGFYSSFGLYCQQEEVKYGFMIDEEGTIYKCPFGIWEYSDIEEYKDGKFNERFKEFSKKFYRCFISNCKSCIRIYNHNHR